MQAVRLFPMQSEIREGIMSENNKQMKVNIGMASLAFLILIQISLFAYGYGSLCQQVRFNRELIQVYQNNQVTMMDKLDELNTRITRLELIISQME